MNSGAAVLCSDSSEHSSNGATGAPTHWGHGSQLVGAGEGPIRDPICGREVGPESSFAVVHTSASVRTYFCSATCLKQYMESRQPSRVESATSGRQEASISIRDAYYPDKLVADCNQPLRLVFLREDHLPCTQEVVFPTIGAHYRLSTGIPLVIDLPPLPPGEHEFHCGNRVLHGAIRME